jgi:hypothetical protein
LSRITLSVLALWAAALPATAGSALQADLVLVGGRVLTLDAQDQVAEAIAIRAGRIAAVGTTAEIERLAGPATERVALGGRSVTPGLIDAHAHFASGGFERVFVLDLSWPGIQRLDDVRAAVATAAAERPAGSWVRGRGWDEGKLAERRYIRAGDIDPVTPDHPVWLSHTMGHYGVANSAALRLAGVTAETPDPPGGTIERDAAGEPTGVLKESAQALVGGLIPAPTRDQLERGIAELARAFNAEGMTAAKDPGIGLAEWEAYQGVLERGELSVRIFALWSDRGTLAESRALAERIAPFSRPWISPGDARLVSGGVKLFADGSGGARTAWVYDEWSDGWDGADTGNRGYPAIDAELLRRKIRLFHEADLHLSVHAIGDRAIDWVVDSYAEALAAHPVAGRRHGLIHANIPTDHALDEIARLQREWQAVYPEPSPGFLWWIGDTYAGNFGPARASRLNPFRSYLERGIRWASGSDFDVTPFPARYGIWASLARETLLGVYGAHPWGEAEAVDRRTALRSYTIWAAHQLFLDGEVGSLEVGKRADLAVWDRDIDAAPVDELDDLRCRMTLLEGRVVYRAEEAP